MKESCAILIELRRISSNPSEITDFFSGSDLFGDFLDTRGLVQKTLGWPRFGNNRYWRELFVNMLIFCNILVNFLL